MPFGGHDLPTLKDNEEVPVRLQTAEKAHSLSDASTSLACFHRVPLLAADRHYSSKSRLHRPSQDPVQGFNGQQ